MRIPPLAPWLVLALAACGDGIPEHPRCDPGLARAATREAALVACTRYFDRTLARAEGDRGDPRVVTFLADNAAMVADAYRASTDDVPRSRAMLELLARFEHTGAVPAFVDALERPRPEPEVHAAIAVRGILGLEEPTPAMRARLARALRTAFERLPGDRSGTRERPSDEALALQLLDALDFLGAEAAPELAALSLRDASRTPDRVVRHVAELLASKATVAEIPALIRGIFPRPDCHLAPLRGLAEDGLVRLGDASVPSLVRVIRGEDPEARRWAELAVPALERTTGIVAPPERIARAFALDALVALEADAAVPELERDAAEGAPRDRAFAIRRLAALRGPSFDRARLRARVLSTLDALDAPEHADLRGELLATVDATFDGEMLPTLLAYVRARDENPAVRVAAAHAYARLATRDETAALRAALLAEPATDQGGLREAFAPVLAATALADRCDAAIACHLAALGDTDPAVVAKALTMVGRLGTGDEATLSAVAATLARPEFVVSDTALRVISHLAARGSPVCLARIESLLNRPESEITRQFNPHAVQVARRLRGRGLRNHP